MKDSRFTTNPVRLDRQRSVFDRNYQHKMSLEFGKLNLIGYDEVLPGDTFSTDLAFVVRMDTPIAPIMDNMFIDIYHFFVPNRLTWEHWKEFQGESDTAWVQSQDYVVPQIKIQNDDQVAVPATGVGENYLDQAGVPVEQIFGTAPVNGTLTVDVSALPFRGIQRVWNDYFRDINVQDASLTFAYDDNDVEVALSDQNADFEFETPTEGLTALYKVGKYHDLFTSSLVAPQRGGSVRLPMAGEAPIITSSTITGFGTLDPIFTVSGTNAIYSGAYYDLGIKATKSSSATEPGEGVPMTVSGSMSSTSNQHELIGSNLVADLSRATAATVNQLRIAIQTQKYLEAMARGGNRYIESLKAIFGVNAPNGLLQRAEYLGGKRQAINVDQVLSHAETDLTDGTNPVGQTGAYSLTTSRDGAYTKSFVEHGYVLSFAVIRQEHTYGQGVPKMLKRKNLLDFYVPQLANIGEVPVQREELFASLKQADRGVFGYQEAWYDYRYRSSFTSGKLNPVNKLSLNYWTLADNFATAPTLSEAFIQENDDNLKRVLVHGSDADVPQFIGDFYFKQKVAREMPLYSIPGLVDHH